MSIHQKLLPLVSVITPTHGRHQYLSQLAACVQEQSYPHIEWLILDDSQNPWQGANFASRRPMRYKHTVEHYTIGDKRNELVAMAQGAVIMHFDDDDFYAPGYVGHRVNDLLHSGADLSKFCGFYVLDDRTNELLYWDQSNNRRPRFQCTAGIEQRILPALGSSNVVLQDDLLHGFGFSYVYNRALWELSGFPSVDHSEDLAFVRNAQTHNQLIHLLPDEIGLCLHRVHNLNTSSAFPQYVLPPFLAAKLFPYLRSIRTQ